MSRKKGESVTIKQGMRLHLLAGAVILIAIMAAVTVLMAVQVRDRAGTGFDSCLEMRRRNAWEFLENIAGDESRASEEREALYYTQLYNSIFKKYAYFDYHSSSRPFVPEEESETAEPEQIGGETFVLIADPEGTVLKRQNSYFTVYSDEAKRDIIVELPEDFDQTIPEGANSIAISEAEIEGVMISPYQLRLTRLISREDTEVKVIYESEIGEDEQVVTFTDEFLIIHVIFEKMSPFSVHGVHYEDLEDYARSFLEKYARTWGTEDEPEAHIAHYGLFQLVTIGVNWIPSLEPEQYNIVVTVGRCLPMLTAVKTLHWWYAAAAAAWAVWAIAVGKQMKKRLFRQVGLVTDHMQDGARYFYDDPDAPKGYREAEILVDGYKEMLQKQRMDQNEITRLKTALSYAKEAEERRRAMTSAIAHELKTPLAVVHGYAEGLKANIAQDKQEQYLDTILGETERMDAMVLEMLDLSRLEAGRVKLARDEVDLAVITRDILQRLQPLAQARGLTFEVQADEARLFGDEARLAQVVENLCSNAVRYAKADTVVKVKVGRVRQGLRFAIENETERPLSGEELTRVWETFYRTDKARSEKGTGLGLAIAKNIVEMHGGSVLAENTNTGVRFSFTIPG